jgi:kynureninase
MMDRGDCEALDANDPLRGCRNRFEIPEGLIYLDGNSLGVLPKGVAERVARTVTDEWGQSLIRAWNSAGWFELPRRVGDRIAGLIGAAPGSVVAGDTISINLFKILGAALQLVPERRVILSDSGNFPSDLYVAQGLRDLLGAGYTLRVVAPEEVAAALSPDVAVLMVTEVDYRTARRHDMKSLTARAHSAGTVTMWDLAHSAGALPVDLGGTRADFAVGCTYKYLNGGPGSPAFLYVRPDLHDKAAPPLAGWWGHAAPFAFDPTFVPAPGIARYQCGTQPITAMAALDAALDVFDGVNMAAIRAKSVALCSLFTELAEARCGGFGVRLSGPRDFADRGSHVSLHCPEGYAVMQALIAENVIGDFRAPDMIRFGFTPLYTRFVDAWDAVETLRRILAEERWNQPKFLRRQAVT